jgi:hypothetical protein
MHQGAARHRACAWRHGAAAVARSTKAMPRADRRKPHMLLRPAGARGRKARPARKYWPFYRRIYHFRRGQ